MKTCKKCLTEKPLDDFYKSSGMKDGYRNDCIECNKESRKGRYDSPTAVARSKKWREDNPEQFKVTQKAYRDKNKDKIQLEHFAWRFNLSTEQALDWWGMREFGCCLCNSVDNLHFDHNHETGTPRGWLCQPHNMAIGLFKDDSSMLRRAASYLEKE